MVWVDLNLNLYHLFKDKVKRYFFDDVRKNKSKKENLNHVLFKFQNWDIAKIQKI